MLPQPAVPYPCSYGPARDVGRYHTVSGLVLATANDEIPDICLSFSPKITRKKSVESNILA